MSIIKHYEVVGESETHYYLKEAVAASKGRPIVAVIENDHGTEKVPVNLSPGYTLRKGY